MQNILYTASVYAFGMHIFVILHKTPKYGNLLLPVRIRSFREEFWRSAEKILTKDMKGGKAHAV